MPESLQPKKILIVDDTEINRYTLSKMISVRGIEVLQAATGGEAIALAQQSPDLALIDIHLPDMTGYQVLEEVRKNPVSADLCVVLMSATEPPPAARSAAAHLGVHSFLTLPVVSDDLWVVIQANFQRQKRR